MKNQSEVNALKPVFRSVITGLRASALTLMLLLSGLTYNAVAAEKTLTTEQSEARVIAIKERVSQIQAMDLKHMSSAEKKDIRNELKDMKKEMRQLHPTGIYVSGGALILIIILLILLV